MSKLEKILLKEDRSRLEVIKTFVNTLFAKGTPANPYFTLHGPSHSRIVCRNLEAIIKNSGIKLNKKEIFYLLSGAWLHDIGMIDSDRSIHHLRSQEIVNSLKDDIIFKDNDIDLKYIGLICKGHRVVDLFSKEYEDDLSGEYKIRISLLASLLRIADELDLDYKRAPRSIYEIIIKKDIYDINCIHWLKHYCVKGVSYSCRIDSNRKKCVEIEISTRSPSEAHKRSIHKIISSAIQKELSKIDPILSQNGILLKIIFKNTIENIIEFPDNLMAKASKAESNNVKGCMAKIKNCYNNKDLIALYNNAKIYLNNSLSSLVDDYSISIHSLVRKLNYIIPAYLRVEINFIDEIDVTKDITVGAKTIFQRNAKLVQIFLSDYYLWFTNVLVQSEFNSIKASQREIHNMMSLYEGKGASKKIFYEIRKVFIKIISLKCTEITCIKFYENDVTDSKLSPNEIALGIIKSNGYDINNILKMSKDILDVSNGSRRLTKKFLKSIYDDLIKIIDYLKPSKLEISNDDNI